jgi:hypothetical protein
MELVFLFCVCEGYRFQICVSYFLVSDLKMLTMLCMNVAVNKSASSCFCAIHIMLPSSSGYFVFSFPV